MWSWRGDRFARPPEEQAGPGTGRCGVVMPREPVLRMVVACPVEHSLLHHNPLARA